ncbi:hypothetical protein ILUMI_25837 [Ignelater luminosus]|uniref:Major facilitator superfamily (MFS) profile domain-containing protein n=1 Tax=Ignelater luminosus TaxID=2038154 RepID=A0A8K0C6Q1_IGNLU|nr:hypothetical protein ILUMI_25837 [Ignelater luminosus]
MPCYNLVIALSTPEHWCNVPGRKATNYTVDEWKMLTIPKEYSNERYSYSKCSMFNTSRLLELNETFPQNFTNSEVIDCQYGWEYDKTWYSETAVSQEDWVCEKELYVANTFALCRIGELLEAFVAGQLGDLVGRKPVFLATLIALVIGKFASVFTAHIFPLFLVAALIGSLSSTAVYSSPLIIAMEICKDTDRAHIAMLQCLGWTIGLATMPLIMWGVGHWTYFMVLTTLPCALFLFLYGYLIESPRWLISRGKTARCIKELQKIAKVNKTELPKDAILTLNLIAKDTEKVYGMMSLFSHWRLAKNTICIVICWIVTLLSYLVIILNTTNLNGNPFLNFFYQGLAEFPAYIIGRYVCDYFGRRWMHMGAFIGTTLGCLPLIMFINDSSFQWLVTTIVVFLKFCISFAFYSVNLHALEIYPTCLRQTGMALCSLSANAFCILGPYIVYLGTAIDTRYPYIILALMSTLATICGFILPETLNYKLPQTLAEAHNFGTEQEFCSVPKTPKQFEPVKT